ncbi:MAG TPA: hypothetical protein VIV60_28060, partial [Polyangiaceae bacterium]
MTFKSIHLVTLLCVLAPLACAPAIQTPPRQATPNATASPVDAKPAPTAAPPTAIAAPKVVGEVPTSCAALAQTPVAASTGDCPKDDVARLSALDRAMAIDDVVTRDTSLKTIEGCGGFEPGLMRALRADLAPPECADAIVDALLKPGAENLGIEVAQVLRGLSLGARLIRTSDQPPQLTPPFSRENFQAFLKSSIAPWYVAQSKVVFDMASSGAKLSGYGKAIVALEAGLSDLRFVENMRKVSLPAEMTADREVVEVYQQSLEDALDPRKLRGRDAVLVAMINLS